MQEQGRFLAYTGPKDFEAIRRGIIGIVDDEN